MRIEKRDPSQEYVDFWDWIARSWHVLLLVSMAFGYIIYQLTTEEK